MNKDAFSTGYKPGIDNGKKTVHRLNHYSCISKRCFYMETTHFKNYVMHYKYSDHVISLEIVGCVCNTRGIP